MKNINTNNPVSNSQEITGILYADFKVDTNEMFIITPSGAEIIFKDYTEKYEAIIIDDIDSKKYLVRFDV